MCSLSGIKVQWAWWCFSLSFVLILSWVLITTLAVAFFSFFFFYWCIFHFHLVVTLQRSGSGWSQYWLVNLSPSTQLLCVTFKWKGIHHMFLYHFCYFFFSWFSLSAVEGSAQALMSSQKQCFVDIICLLVSLPELSRVVNVKPKNSGRFSRGWSWAYHGSPDFFFMFFSFPAEVKIRLFMP